MFKKQSLITRIAIGKSMGFIIGLVGFILLPFVTADASLMLRLGILFWYVTFGAVIGVFGVFTYHPILKCSMPWYFRSIVLGSWMNLILALVAYDELLKIMLPFFGQDSIFSSPFWIVLEGAIVALVIDYFATKIGGEGGKIVDKKI